MPFTTAGELSFVSELELGDAGPKQGRPVILHWPWTRNLWRFLPWFLLASLFLLPVNRNRSAVMGLVPVAALCWFWFVLRVSGVGEARDLEMMLGAVVITLGALYLLSPLLTTESLGGSYARLFLAALAILFAIELAWAGGELGVLVEFGPLAALPALCVVTLLAGLALAAFLSRKRSNPVQFVGHIVLAVPVLASTGCLLVALLLGGIRSPLDLVLQLLAGLLLGGVYLLLGLPFLILGISEARDGRLRTALHAPAGD